MERKSVSGFEVGFENMGMNLLCLIEGEKIIRDRR